MGFQSKGKVFKLLSAEAVSHVPVWPPFRQQPHLYESHSALTDIRYVDPVLPM